MILHIPPFKKKDNTLWKKCIIIEPEHMAVTEGFEPSGKFPRLCLSRTVYLAELYHIT